MIVELGHFALVTALVVALVQSTLPLWGARRLDATLVATASPAAACQFILVSIAFAALTHAHVVSDFSVVNVVTNSHSTKPLVYKIAGVWANHEGSLILWVWILALFGATVALGGRQLPATFRARVLAVQGMIGAGFLLFILWTSNPFLRLSPAPLDGDGLNPILQDPGLAMHPPMLYLGYVGFSTTFSFAVAGLLEGRIDPSWARWVRPWTLAAWTSLTLGIGLGSWWAYYELGWGGFWFWDPVENASLMPWLAGTALLHSAIVVEKRDSLKSWTLLLAILTFALSLLGTFLVRSGVLTSVHAFATDPTRGVFILALLGIAIGGSLTLYAWRAPGLQGGGRFAPISREAALLLNNLILATATATVLLGTLYPLLLDVIGGPKISVGAPFFNAVFVPLALPLALALPVGSMLAWKRGDLAAVLLRLRLAAAAAAVVGLVVLLLLDQRSATSLVGYVAASWLILGSIAGLTDRAGLASLGWRRGGRRLLGLPRAAWAMAIAHAGLGLVILGITATATGRAERLQLMRPGDLATLAGYSVRLDRIEDVRGPNWIAQRGLFTVTRAGAPVASLHSDRRFYPIERQSTTEAGIDTGIGRDLYVVLGERSDDGSFAVRIYHHPLAFWIWGGCIAMAAGGLLSLTDRALRVGAPRPARPREEALPA